MRMRQNEEEFILNGKEIERSQEETVRKSMRSGK